MKILLVADADWILNEAAAALSDPDMELGYHEDPRTVVERCEDFEPDVVIVDMQVGSMGGMAVARDLKDAEYGREATPAAIILLLDRSADVFLARRAAADAWVVKPFTPQQLRAALESATVAEEAS